MSVLYVKSLDEEDCASCPGSTAAKESDDSLSASRDDREGTRNDDCVREEDGSDDDDGGDSGDDVGL